MRKRLTYIPDTQALTILGYSVQEDGDTLCSTGPAKRLVRLIYQASEELTFTRGEWNAIADVMNGCADIFDYAESEIPPLLLLVANLQDADHLDGLGEKWEISIPDLCAKLQALQPLHGEAILCAIRWAWRNPQAWDHTRDSWWKPEFRLVKQRRGADASTA